MPFEHCETREAVLTTFFDLACLCHPDQGGAAEDMDALVAMARERFSRVCADSDAGAAWPFAKDRPSVMDAYCVAKGIPNPFDAPLDAALPAPPPAGGPAAFEPPGLAPVPRMGRIWLR